MTFSRDLLKIKRPSNGVDLLKKFVENTKFVKCMK